MGFNKTPFMFNNKTVYITLNKRIEDIEGILTTYRDYYSVYVSVFFGLAGVIF